MSFRDAANAILAVSETSSRIEKGHILRASDSPVLREVLRLAYDPMITYGIRAKAEYGRVYVGGSMAEPGTEEFPWEAGRQVLEALRLRAKTGTAAIVTVRLVLEFCRAEEQALFAGILNKDLACGMDIKSINAVFPGLINHFQAMKADDYSPEAAFWPALGEVKEDGMRLISRVRRGEVTQLSYTGLVQSGYEHLDSELCELARSLGLSDGGYIDAELMYPRFGSRKKKTDKVLKVFDFLSLEEFETKKPVLTQGARSQYLEQAFLDNSFKHLFLTEGRQLNTQEDAEAFYNEVVEAGGEGIMLKNPYAVYEFDRSPNWLKMKPKNDVDLEIVGVYPGKKGKRLGGLGGFICLWKGKEIKVGEGFSDAQVRDFWENPPIGQIAEIRYTSETPYGNFLFARFRRLRTDK